MKKPNLESIEKELERKVKKKERRKKGKMKVDSSSVKKLGRIIAMKENHK